MRKRYVHLTPAEWDAKIKAAQELAAPCRLCPRQCQVDRQTSFGFCRQGPLAVAHIQDHFGEEPFLVGEHGSAAFFFSGCNLGCVYCQNWEISRGRFPAAQKMTAATLANHFLQAQTRQVSNLNLVTPTIFLPDILQALHQAALAGLNLPVVYNTSSYESPAALAILENVADIYLADLKYDDAAIARRYSAAADYPRVAQQALQIMQQQMGGLIWRQGELRRGLVIRHLVLPGQVAAAQRIAAWVKSHLPQAYFSLLAQYDPPACLLNQEKSPQRPINDPSEDFKELQRGLTAEEYAAAWAATTQTHRIGQQLQAARAWRPCFAQAGEDKFRHDA